MLKDEKAAVEEKRRRRWNGGKDLITLPLKTRTKHRQKWGEREREMWDESEDVVFEKVLRVMNTSTTTSQRRGLMTQDSHLLIISCRRVLRRPLP